MIDGRLVLSDPRAMRALAHEARLAIIDALDSDATELTASELAGRVGISPSALSYHLRVLERFGIVRRAAPRDDGRERPWVRVAEGIVIDAPGSTAGFSAQSTLISHVLHSVQEHWDDWIRVEPDEPEAWHDSATMARSRLWLTAEETAGLVATLDEALADYRGRRGPETRPAGAREVELVTMAIPRPDAS